MSSTETASVVSEYAAPERTVPALRGYGVEVAGYRAPDGEVTIEVFLDGVLLKHPLVDIVDPGRGSPYSRRAWRANAAAVAHVGGSPAWVSRMQEFYGDAEERYTIDDLPSYTEAEPLGPTDAGDAGGDAQMSTAYCRRFIRSLPDGRYGALDVECYVVNVETDPDKPVHPVLARSFGFTVCTDPADVGATEEQSDTHYDPDIEHVPGTPEFTDADAHRLCAEFDVSTADLSWTYHMTGEDDE